MRWSFQWQTPNDSTSFHDLRVLTSRTWCESPRWRICLWGGLIYLFFRAYNQVRQQCKALGDVVFFSSILHNTTLHVSERGWSGRPCKGPVTLWERQNTSWRRRRYVPLRCSARDGQHPGRQPYSISIPYSVTLFSCAAALSHWSRPPGCTPGLSSTSRDLENILNSNVTGLASTGVKAAKLWHLKLA